MAARAPDFPLSASALIEFGQSAVGPHLPE
jgi:hypothetical protein